MDRPPAIWRRRSGIGSPATCQVAARYGGRLKSVVCVTRAGHCCGESEWRSSLRHIIKIVVLSTRYRLLAEPAFRAVLLEELTADPSAAADQTREEQEQTSSGTRFPPGVPGVVTPREKKYIAREYLGEKKLSGSIYTYRNGKMKS